MSHLLATTLSLVAATYHLISPTTPLPDSLAQSVIRLPWQRSAYGRQRSDHYGLRDPESEGHDFEFFFVSSFSLSPFAPFHPPPSVLVQTQEVGTLGSVLDVALTEHREV